jgi:hypothetical protein
MYKVDSDKICTHGKCSALIVVQKTNNISALPQTEEGKKMVVVTLQVSISNSCVCKVNTQKPTGLSASMKRKIDELLTCNPDLTPSLVSRKLLSENDMKLPGDRRALRDQIQGYAKRHRANPSAKTCTNATLTPPVCVLNVGDLLAVTAPITFHPPRTPNTGLTSHETDISAYGSELFRNNLLQVIKPYNIGLDETKAYQLMTVLRPFKEIWDDHQSREEKELTQKIEELIKSKKSFYEKQKEGCPRDTTTVFTSLALLSNILYCRNLQWRVQGAANGTNGTVQNTYQLLTFCAISVNNQGTSQCHPLLFALAPGERQETFAITMLAFLKYCRLLFGITNIAFHGGLVSDHSSVFTTPFGIAFPSSPRVQCYTHIIWKFLLRSRPGNGGYSNLVSGRKKI